MARYRFWIHDKDRNGDPLDENILKTAKELAPIITRYRRREIDDESESNAMLQTAVEAASHAKRGNQIQNLPGYLTSIYRRVVDKCLERQNKLVPVDNDFLEDLANAGNEPSFEDLLHKRMVLEQLLKSMDPETQEICDLRLEGYSELEIAEMLGTTPNAVSVRFTRGFKKAAARLIKGDRSLKKQ